MHRGVAPPVTVARPLPSGVAHCSLRLRHEQRGHRVGRTVSSRSTGRCGSWRSSPAPASPASPRSPLALEVHKSTAFRLVATLEQHGLVEQVEGRGKYRLGVGLLRLAGATSARLDVVQEARPLCKQLAAATGETVNLATLSRQQRALPRPGRRTLGAAAAQLGRPAHPAARHEQRQGADGVAAGCRAQDLLGRLPAYTGLTITARQAAQGARGRPRERVRRGGGRARGGAHRDRRAGAQRPRRRRSAR